MKTRPAAVFTDEMPQILILHTHATESYTMPEGQEYNDDGATRTEDTDYNVVRVGDEIAEVFEEAGISVLHDRTLYDCRQAPIPARMSRAASPPSGPYLAQYPSIRSVLDVHRDAIEDSEGNELQGGVRHVSGEGTAAQLSHGGGQRRQRPAPSATVAGEPETGHVLLQQDLLAEYPTLMRPMPAARSPPLPRRARHHRLAAGGGGGGRATRRTRRSMPRACLPKTWWKCCRHCADAAVRALFLAKYRNILYNRFWYC